MRLATGQLSGLPLVGPRRALWPPEARPPGPDPGALDGIFFGTRWRRCATAPDRGGARQHQIEAMRDAFERARPSTERARAMSLVEVNDRSVSFKVEGGASFIRSQSP